MGEPVRTVAAVITGVGNTRLTEVWRAPENKEGKEKAIQNERKRGENEAREIEWWKC